MPQRTRRRRVNVLWAKLCDGPRFLPGSPVDDFIEIPFIASCKNSSQRVLPYLFPGHFSAPLRIARAVLPGSGNGTTFFRLPVTSR